MRTREFTLIDLLIVIGVLAVLFVFLAMLAGPLMGSRLSALKVSCVSNLSQIGKASFQYESSSYFNKAPDPLDRPVSQRNTNNFTLVPLLALFQANLLDNTKILLCPVYSQVYDQTISDAVLNQSNSSNGFTPLGATNYLFTYFYQKDAQRDRVIAGDASGSREKGYSPNHGDEAFAGATSATSTASAANGANALFKDGHVRASNSVYQVEGAQNRASTPATPANLWDAGGVELDPATDTATGTQIGAYQ